MNNHRRVAVLAVAILGMLAISGCSGGELTGSGSPVLLVVTNSQNLNRIDLAPTDDPDCQQNVGTIEMKVLPKNATVTGSFTQVRVQSYRVSYRRTDGGTQVPAPFTRAVDVLIGVNETGGIDKFLIMEPTALFQAPFAALLPQNGGRDAETGSQFVKMNVIVEIFGETLGGDRVYDATAFQLDFCYGCGGCD